MDKIGHVAPLEAEERPLVPLLALLARSWLPSLRRGPKALHPGLQVCPAKLREDEEERAAKIHQCRGWS